MNDIVNPKEIIAISRLQELLSPNTPWYRSLWNIGLVLNLKELHEACIAVTIGALGEPAVKRLCQSLIRQIGKDPTITKPEKGYINSVLSPPPEAEGMAHHAIATFAAHIKRDYIKRWAGVTRQDPNFSIERFARSVAAHLLDEGFSGQHLHNFVKTRTHGDQLISLSELCEELDAEIAHHPFQEFQVLILFAKTPNLKGVSPPNWVTSSQSVQWLRAHGYSTANIRPSGGLVLTVSARDTQGAAMAARNQLDRFQARAAIATGDQLQLLPSVWVDGANSPYPLDSNTRGVRVKALFRENLTFASSTSQNVDAAIELLSHLDRNSPAAAIAGGWGAIEGLLGDPGNRSAAADNLAALVACSLPRAELLTR